MRIDVSHLIERCRKYELHGTDPATGVDCWWFARAILQERYPDMPDHELPITDDEIAHAIDAGGPASPWRKIGETSAAATRVGDLVFGHRMDGTPYTMVVVDEAGRISAMMLTHGACLRETRAVHGICAVYRRSA